MPEYLATCRNAEGKQVTECLEADSADEAVAQLRERGYDEVVLHTDDVMAHYGRASDVAETFTPREYLRFRHLPAPLAIFLPVCLKLYQKGWATFLLALVVLLYRRAREAPWGVLDWLPAAYLALPPLVGLVSQLLPGTSKRYERLMEAFSWGRWEEVLALADGVGGKVPPEEIAFRKASALAGLGRLDEAVQLVRPFGDGAAMPEWLYRSRLAEVYGTAQRHDEAAAEVEQALRLAPDNATVLMEAAKSEVWHRRNPRRARELLDRARQHALSDVLQPFAACVEGLICLEEGRPHEAQSLLGQAYQGAAAFRHASPLVGAALDLMHAALARAAAGTGDLPSARRHFRLARPRLEALKQDQVIARCEQALGADDGS